jgi:hypothetical protein
MDEREGLEQLPDKRFRVRFAEVAARNHVLEEFFALAELHEYIIVMIVAQEIDELDNAGVVKLLDDANLELKAGVEIARVEADARNDLAGKGGRVAAASREADNGERAFPDDFVELVWANLDRREELHRRQV